LPGDFGVAFFAGAVCVAALARLAGLAVLVGLAGLTDFQAFLVILGLLESRRGPTGPLCDGCGCVLRGCPEALVEASEASPWF
jgi:hypothetical protein